MEEANIDIQDKIIAGLRYKEIVGDFTSYRVFEDGEVFSTRTSNPVWKKMTPSLSRVKHAAGKMPGYRFFRCTINGRRVPQRIHRILAKEFIPNPENKPQVNHKDGNKQNNLLSNLEWVTAKENAIHAARVLKKVVGENAYQAKLDRHQVAWIRYGDHGLQQKEMAEMLGVHKVTVHHAYHRQSWKDFP